MDVEAVRELVRKVRPFWNTNNSAAAWSEMKTHAVKEKFNKRKKKIV